MSTYRPTIGLEIHAELKTLTKMFCACLNDPDEKQANKNICPVCLAHPGTLPVINREAVHKVLLVGTAVGAELARDFSEFDRKNYFYPDIPKGYQISQYLYPLVKGGTLAGVALTRIHLEEDTARSQHVEDPDKGGKGGQSLVDYNRAGVPLMELVTEPVIHDAETAGRFARELQLLLRYLGAGEANMEKGEMRVEANISVAPVKHRVFDKLGTKVEVKNLNSFRSVERAIAYEIERQSKLLESGGAVVQETRGWDEAKQVTFSQRKKESSHDYRYFPDPDLPKLALSEVKEFSAERLKKELPELPWERRERYARLGFLQAQDIDQLVEDAELADLFGKTEQILSEPALVKTAANFILNDIVGQKKKDPMWPLPDAAYLAEVVRNYQRGLMASPQAKSSILSGRMSAVLDDREMPAIAQKVIDAYPQVATDYKAGKEAALQFLVGQGMKETKGSANPGVLRQAILELLK
jgi:aspartyl-tRNA(Asn)/glutamyl-tRNA(Gln) amidotransferase subunit B